MEKGAVNDKRIHLLEIDIEQFEKPRILRSERRLQGTAQVSTTSMGIHHISQHHIRFDAQF